MTLFRAIEPWRGGARASAEAPFVQVETRIVMCVGLREASGNTAQTPSAREGYVLDCAVGGVCGHALINFG